MMLNGLQTSSRTLPLDTSSAKHLPMDAETTEPVSFGMLLKLKEKQLQQEQEVSASFVAAAVASLQTPQFVASLPIQSVETGETVTGTGVTKASTNAISQTVTTPIEGSDRLPLTQSPAQHASVTEPIQSMDPAVVDSVNENAFQQALVKPELSDVLSPTSFGKSTISPTTNPPIPAQPVQLTEQVLTAEVAKITPTKRQVSASIPSPKSDAISARDAIQATEPAAENQVSTVSITAKASLPTLNSGMTTKKNVAEENIKINTTNVPQAARNLDISTQTFPVNSTPSEDKTNDGTFSSIDAASKTVVMPEEEETKDHDFLIADGTKSKNREAVLIPNLVFRVQTNTDTGNTPSSSPDAIGVDSQESGLQTSDAPVASQLTKNQKAETNKTIEFRNASVTVQTEIKENIRSYQTTIKGNETVLEPLPVRIIEDVPAQDLPTQSRTDNSTIQQIGTTFRGQQSKSSAPDISAPSLFSTSANEKIERRITLPVEDGINSGTLHLDNTVDEIISTPEIELGDNPVGEPTFKQKIVVPTNVDPGFVKVTTTNSRVELPNNRNSHNEVEISSTGGHIQSEEFSVRLDQPKSQNVKIQVEQSPLGKVGKNETNYGQTAKTASIPIINDVPLGDDQAGFNSISTSERTVEQLSDAQGKIDLNITTQGSTRKVNGREDPGKRTFETANTDRSNTTTQILNTKSEDAPFEPSQLASSIETTNSSPLMVSSEQLSTLTENVLPISQSAIGSQEREVSNTKEEEKIDSIALKNSWAESETIQASDKPEMVNVFSIRAGVHDITSTKPVRDLISGEPFTLPQTDPSLEIEPETEAFTKQVIISRPEQDPSYAATKSERNIPLAFETVGKKINLPTDNSGIQEKNSTILSSHMIMPTKQEFIDGEAGIRLHTSLVAEEVLENVFDPDTTSNIQSSQSITGSIKPQNSQRQIEVEIPLSEQVVVEPSEILASDFNIDTHKIATEMKVDEKIQSTESNLSKLDAAVRSETLETRVANMATVVMDLVGVENNTLQSRYVESDNTADLTGHDLSKTASSIGNQDVADGELPVGETNISSNIGIETSQQTGSQSSSVFSKAEIEKIEKSDFAAIESQSSSIPGETVNMLHVDIGISADGDLSKSSTNENISLQTTQNTKSYETVPQVSDESSFQPEGAKAGEAKNGETQIHVDLPMDQSAQNGTIQFHENKSKSDVDVKPEGFKSSGVGADEKINTRTESINDVRPASHQAPGVVEILTDPISPALPNAHTVNGPDVTRKPRQIENDEKTLPAEKQPRVNQTPGIAAPANGPVKDTPTTHLVGSGPSNQLPGDVKEVVDHVIRHINSNLKNGPTSMHLQLSPKELGAIDVQMVSDSQGVHVTFFAEQASTGKLLETQLDQLRVSLLDSGVHLSGLDIGQHNQSGQKGGSFEQSPNFTRDFSWNFPDAQTVSQEKPSLKRSLGRSSDIDYLI